VAWSCAVLRFTLGTAFVFHGVTRFVSGWSAFADQKVQSFPTTFLLDFLVRPFALSVPPVEAVLGMLLCLGLYAAYFPSKRAIPTMTRALAVELGTRNPQVRVTCIMPGPVLLPPDLPGSERQQAITGVCLPVDGGRTVPLDLRAQAEVPSVQRTDTPK
jgi:hypothetical protein